MKRNIPSILLLLAVVQASAQKPVQHRQQWEYEYDIPVYADSIKAELTYPLAWGNSPETNFDKWKQTARQKVLDCMLAPPRRATDFHATLLAEEQRDGYRAQKLSVWLNAYRPVIVYLLLPDTPGKHPAINVLHDHGAHLYIGKEKVIRPICEDSLVEADAQEWVGKLYDGQFVGDNLARQGYVVLATDAPLWGERGRKEGVDRSKYDRIAGNMMMLGRNLSAWMTYDDITATDFLATLPQVDTERIGCFGFSMGAYRAWMLAALSPRVKATAAVCWMVTTDAQLDPARRKAENGGFANCIPGLRQWLDYPHIASLACPGSMLLISGSEDKLFPVAGVRDAFATMQQVWQSQGYPERLQTELWPMPHHCGKDVQERVDKFFKENL